MQRIYLLSTGGTIEKVYSEQSGVVENRAAKLDRYLRMLRLPDAEIRAEHLMNKDSLEMTDADRAEVRDRVAGLLAEGVKQHPLGVFARLLHEASPEAQTPAANRSRENRHCPEAPGHDDSIQGIHSESFLFQENPSRLLERGDR